MRNIVTLLLFINTCILINAQNIKITGKMLDENSDAVIAATVSFLSRDSTLIMGTATNSFGNFELTTLKRPDLYYLRVTHIEFEDSYHPIVLDKDTTITVRLKRKVVLLGEVQVVAKKQIYEFQNEKLVVNVNNIPNIQTYNLSRLLQTLPGVINSSGSLTLNGKSVVIYLDGRKQRIDLASLPVAAIEKIELIYSSGGIYDASDEAIINIVHKKQKMNGYYLSVGGNAAGYDEFNLDGGGSSTIMFKKKNVMFNSTLTYRNTYTSSIANDTLRYPDNSFLYQNRNSEGRMDVFMGLLNLSWDIRKGHNLNFNINFYDDFSSNTSKQQYTFQKDDINHNSWNVKSKGNDDMWSGQVEYSSPDSLNNKFKASYSTLYGGLQNRQHTFEENSMILHTDDEVSAYRHIFKFDYDHVFSSKMNLLFGLKADLGRLNDDVTYVEPTISNRYPSSYFSGKENIYAAYAQIKYAINNKWSANASLRSEHTYYHLDFLTQNEKISDSYTNLFPYFTASYNSRFKKYQSSLSLGSSIQRPDYNYMLPGVRYSGQYNYVRGNPDLKPTIRYTIMWRNQLYQFVNVFLSYESGSDLRGFVAKNSSIDPLIIEYEHQNIADFNRIYFGSYIYYNLWDRLSGQIGATVHYFNYTHSKNGFEFPNGKSDYWQGVAYLNSNIKITKQLGVNYVCYFYPKYDNLIYTTHAQWLINMGIYYNSPKENWSLSLDANDIFRSARFREMYFDNNYSRQHNYGSSRYVQLSFILKFRSGEKIEDKAKSGNIELNRFSKKQ